MAIITDSQLVDIASSAITASNLKDTKDMDISTNGLNFIKSKEGLITTAKKGAGETYYTIGYGHYGADVEAGDTITEEGAVKLLYKDLQYFVEQTRAIASPKFPALTQSEFDALVSYCYNRGPGDRDGSNGLRQLIENSNSKSEIYNNFLIYWGTNTAVKEGLLNRRKAEQELFSDGNDYGDSISGISGAIGTATTVNVPDYISLSLADPYSDSIASNLEKVKAEGYDLGYLIDLSTAEGGEFKFYIPEFNESAGAQWANIDIPGRSVQIKSYQSTSSRVIKVDLELYAGVGLYTSGDDVVGAMHKDINFVKSLEYPDYQNSVARPPATVLLILGSAINISGVVSGVSVDHLKPLDSQNRAMYVKLSFTVTQTTVNPPDYLDIRNNRTALISTSDISSMEG